MEQRLEMMTDKQNVHAFAARRTVRNIVVVSKRGAQDVLETVLDAGDYDVVIVEGIAEYVLAHQARDAQHG